MGKKSRKNKARKEKQQQQVEPQSASFWKKPEFLWGLGLIAFTILAYSQTFGFDFVNWDDDRNFYQNDLITTLNSENFWSNTKAIFSTTVIGNYNPLTIWTFAIEKMAYGFDQPGKWHLTNVVLHAACVYLVYRLMLVLGMKGIGAIFVAILFAIHPMRVESVAWVTERKDVLFGFFYLWALLLYAKGRYKNKVSHLWIFVLFVLALFSKIQAVALPLSFILIDYWVDGKLGWKSIFKKWPYFLGSLIFGLLGIYFLKDQGSLESNSTYPIWQRIFVGTYSYLIYLIKVVFPYRMSPMYPYAPQMPVIYYPTLLMLPLVLWGLYQSYIKQFKAIFFGLSFFTVNIIFLLQILGAGQGFLADRFTYIAYLGLFFIAGYYIQHAIADHQKRNFVLGVVAVVSLSYLFLNFQQQKIWRNSETLWTHVLRYYKQTTLPYGNRANYLRDQGRYQEALRDYSASIALDPKKGQAHNSRARLYFDTGKSRDTLLLALQDYNQAIALDPTNGEFYINRGATHARLGQVQKAIEDLNTGLTYKPDHAVGYLNRSVMYNQLQDFPNALRDIESYLKLRPYNADMWYEKARILRATNRIEASIPAYNRAIELNPNRGLYYYERSRTLQALNQIAQAKADLNMAKSLQYNRIDPQYEAMLMGR